MLAYGRKGFKEMRIMEAFWRVYKVGRYLGLKKGQTITITMMIDMIKAGMTPDMNKIIAETPDIDLRAVKTYYKLQGMI